MPRARRDDHVEDGLRGAAAPRRVLTRTGPPWHDWDVPPTSAAPQPSPAAQCRPVRHGRAARRHRAGLDRRGGRARRPARRPLDRRDQGQHRRDPGRDRRADHPHRARRTRRHPSWSPPRWPTCWPAWSSCLQGELVARCPARSSCTPTCATAGVPVALVSSSYRVLVDAVVERLDLRFDLVLAGDEVRHAKPHPEPYLTACARLECRPARRGGAGGQPAGIASGEAAGCAVVAVPERGRRRRPTPAPAGSCWAR